MDENDIIGVVREYLEDKENSYALMLTGEWGCGKTYFVEHTLTEKLEEDESRHPVVVASAYGAKDLAELCGAIEARFVPIDGMPRVTTGFLHRRGAEPSDDAQTFMRSLRALFRARYADYSRAHPV